jgi:hypothetical protein
MQDLLVILISEDRTLGRLRMGYGGQVCGWDCKRKLEPQK